jgi:threonine synthase
VRDLWIKDDGRNPTGSLKDRASAMVVAHAMRLNVAVVTTASTGNAAAALAGIAASIGMRAVIFVPSSAPEAKIAQLRVYGAEVNLVQGTYDEAFDLCLVTAEKNGWYCRNTGINPYTTEGKKTVSYEIAEQLGWESPDVVVVSVGDGSIIGGVYKGFSDLVALGWITKLPRLIGVQAEGSAACYQAWQAGSNGATMQPIRAQTVADSISSDLPRDRVKAIRAVRNSSGAFVTVSDSEILDSSPTLARGSGIFTEPACAATWAGLIRARETGLVAESERVVLLGTGNGLKDIKSAIRSVRDG